MSKKKAFSGSTMTLKDFHGGSIPSDFPLPSAPGVIVRPADRPVYDRQAWGNNSGGRSDHQLRPHLSGQMRGFDDKSPFFGNNVNIGKHFDEDERKPLDGLSGSRRIATDDSIRGIQNFGEAKQDVGRLSGQQSSVPVPPSQLSGGSWSGKVLEGGNAVAGSGALGGNAVQAPSRPYPSAWGVRKDFVGAGVTKPSPFAAHNAIDVSKYAQASAIDKVSSGRWQTKPTRNPAHVEAIRQSELHNSSNLKEIASDDIIHRMNERQVHETDLAIHAERSLTINAFQRGSKDLLPTEKLHLEVSEGPKWNPLPGTKLPDAVKPFMDNKQSARASVDSTDASNVETAGGLQGNMFHAKPGLSDDDTRNRLVERPRLNLKPRSQPIEQEHDTSERRALFGGARPRELVLKERGMNDIAVNDDLVRTQHSLCRLKNDVPRPWTETVPVHPNSSIRGDRGENLPSDHRTGKGGEKNRVDGERADMQRKNWRNENWRSGRDGEKHHQQDQQERQERKPSPETWRKPVDQPKSSDTDASRMRYGKAVSAAELAQAFSSSASERKSSDQFSGQRRLAGQMQIPFSRLTAPAAETRPQINGY